jgi:hypothetical protein
MAKDSATTTRSRSGIPPGHGVFMKQNRIGFPRQSNYVGRSRHCVVTFHETTFECLAAGMEGAFVETVKEAFNPATQFRTV